MYTILLLGSGGREHAIAHAIVQSPKCEKLYVAPGNAGTQEIAFNVLLDIGDFDQIAKFCEQYHIDWIIVGPEQPLVDGIYNYFEHSKIKVIGPSQAAAQLEGSKSFAKAFMAEFNIPTASYKAFTLDEIDQGKEYIKSHTLPIVLKADGLAAGKGVLILEDHEAAISAFEEMLNGKFGKASGTVVVEQFLTGVEFSVFVALDGEHYCILPEAKDYKRIGEGDTGLNTGGMGAVSPVPFVDKILWNDVKENIILPSVSGIKSRNLDYKGFLFIGLILVEGKPYVIEYNCRMGDPETEVVFPRITSDVVELFEAIVNSTLLTYQLMQRDGFTATVFSVSGGYPGSYQKGLPMQIPKYDDGHYYHAGTKKHDSSLVTNGGRVIACTAHSSEMQNAITKALKGAELVSFEGKYYRKDIGKDLLNYL